MNRFNVKCPSCTYPLDAEFYNQTTDLIECRSCKSKIQVQALPALYRKVVKSTEGLKAQLDDAVCFYHAGKKAEQLCDDCGRFLCGLCALPIGEEMLCSSCLELRRKQEFGQHQLKPRQMRYDKLAIGLTVIPLIIYFPVTIVTAPAALFVAIRYWRKKLEFAPGMRRRMVLALIFSSLQISGWIILISFIVWGVVNEQ
ncbi:hypothetical protein P4C99_14225 [Pontiellaceae bacterium B1224]|nr:hypothetical protein [Pontiellaceae bacterium B1224]